MKISVVLATKNEEANISSLIRKIWHELSVYDLPGDGKFCEILVVDDSSDNTQWIAKINGARIIQGQGKGLGQAIIDGIQNAKNGIVVVMDSDFSHEPKAIPHLVTPIVNQGYDLVIGSRYAGGHIIGWERSRRIISRGACLLAVPVTSVKDSTSGFFAFRKDLISGIKLEGKSWKIMLEILVKSKPDKVCEVPITFEVRKLGKSKFNRKQVIAYVKHLFSLTIFRYNKLLRFCLVGGIGALETFGITYLLTEYAHLWYMVSLMFAAGFATISNFLMNSMWTFAIGKSASDADYEWNAYYKGNFIQKYWKRSLVKKVRGMLPENVDKVLDIGCGSSPISTELGVVNYTGVDGNAKKIEYMNKKGLPFNYIFSGNFNDNKVNGLVASDNDVVLSIEVIEHMDNMFQANSLVQTLKEHTKVGGEVIIATPNYGDFRWHIIEKIYGWLMPSAYADDHKSKFTEEGLIRLCKLNGLEHEETRFVAGCDMVSKFRRVNK